ncbi:thrC [Symbiodinium sp. CCMP2592]|nr:thrC [Symbiodinium sp. CCMP2592]
MAGVMNVTVAIFVNSAMDASSVRSRDLAKKAKEEYEATCKALYEVFQEADSDGNGTLSKEEFKKALEEKDLLRRLHGAGIDATSASSLFDILDIDANGTLDGNEFVEGVLRSRGNAQNKDLVGLRCDVWRANLSVHEEIRHVSIYFEERLQATVLKMKVLSEAAAPILRRAQEELLQGGARGDSPSSSCGFKNAPVFSSAEQATGDDESQDPTHSAVLPFQGARSEKSESERAQTQTLNENIIP